MRENVNKIRNAEKHYVEQIFYTQLDPSRRSETSKDKLFIQLKNCRHYLAMMEKFVLSSVKDYNKEFKAKQELLAQNGDGDDSY